MENRKTKSLVKQPDPEPSELPDSPLINYQFSDKAVRHFERAEVWSRYGDALKKYDWLITKVLNFLLTLAALALYFYSDEIVSFSALLPSAFSRVKDLVGKIKSS
ncbi:hypothetical protein [Larkinella humicola]|uniref:Uncharacterized protein n=1 Tax=Larkinella humicola TaxID=2607654 RepID=A0A5N1J7I9_9BACT|nr:hypothetical protein [Larkinella humicola]KAA9341147.1 hypothetical protein F0P93_30395 [Larkinella humicola]